MTAHSIDDGRADHRPMLGKARWSLLMSGLSNRGTR